MEIDTEFLTATLPVAVWQLLFVFCRIGSSMMVMPVFAEVYVLTWHRLLLGMSISVIVTPTVYEFIPEMPVSTFSLLILVAGEVIIGLFMGLAAQVMMTTVTTAGTIIAFQSGMANAMVFNPATAQQSSIVGAFLAAFAMLLIVTTNLHHMTLIAVVESYSLYAPGEFFAVDDFLVYYVNAVSKGFVIAIQLSAPFLFGGLVFYTGIGLLARLLPQIQIFFIALPLQITASLAILMVVLGAIGTWFLRYYEEGIENFLN